MDEFGISPGILNAPSFSAPVLGGDVFDYVSLVANAGAIGAAVEDAEPSAIVSPGDPVKYDAYYDVQVIHARQSA